MSLQRPGSVAIACATGGFKGAFLHGVLSALEAGGFRAQAYAAASSSVLPAAAAALGQAGAWGLDYWQHGRSLMAQPGMGMSQVVLAAIERTRPQIVPDLFRPSAPRFLIAANAVDPAGAAETQGQGARRLGRRLLLAAARGDRSWVEAHLSLHLFDTMAADDLLRLTADNFAGVVYASSRMLHAWDIPAWVGERAYIDAFYTCACPALQAAELGYGRVIALANEPVLHRDIFQDERLPEAWAGATIDIVAPDFDPAELGVSYTSATAEGLEQIYDHGRQKGRGLLSRIG